MMDDKEKLIVVPDEHEVKVDPMSFVPLIVALVGMISTFCTTVLGWEPLPYSNEEIGQGISMVITVIGTVWSWFRNNNVTKKGLKREAVANQAVPKEKKVKK